MAGPFILREFGGSALRDGDVLRDRLDTEIKKIRIRGREDNTIRIRGRES